MDWGGWGGDLWGGLKDLIGGGGGGGPEQLAGPVAEGGGSGIDWGGIASGIGSGAADAAGGIGSGFKSGLDFAGGAAKSALPLAQIGGAVLGGVNAYKGAEQMAEQQKLLKQAQQNQEAAAAPLRSFGQEELALARQGNVPPAVQAQIDEWVAGAKQQVRDYLARSGQGDSTALVQMEAQIDRQAQGMKAAALQDMQRQGVGSLTAASGAAANAAQTAQQQQASLQQLIGQANEQLFRMGGSR